MSAYQLSVPRQRPAVSSHATCPPPSLSFTASGRVAYCSLGKEEERGLGEVMGKLEEKVVGLAGEKRGVGRRGDGGG